MAYNNKDNGKEGKDNGGVPGGEGKVTSAFMQDGELFNLTPSIGLGERLGSQLESNDDSIIMPGICTLEYLPTFGTATNKSDTLNVGAQDVFKKIMNTLRQRNLSYQRTDVMITLMPLDSAHIAYNDIYRMMCALTLNSYKNKYLNQRIVEALGYDYDDLFNHYYDLLAKMKKWRKNLMTYPMPKIFDYVRVHEQMSKFVYADTVSNKAQLYLFVPRALISRENVDTGRGLKYLEWHGGAGQLMGYDTLVNKMNELIDAITDSTDFENISNGIYSAFENEPVVEIPDPSTIDETKFEIYHDANALNAIMNATIIPMTPEEYSKFLPQDSGRNYLTCPGFYVNAHASLNAGASYNIPYKYMNALTDAPTSTELTNFARWKVNTQIHGDAPGIYIESWATEVLVGAAIWTLDDNFIAHKSVKKQIPNGVLTFSSCNACRTSGDLTTFIGAICAFKCHPIVKVFTFAGGDATPSVPIPVTEWNIVAKWPDSEAYHDALIWKSIVNQ